MRVRCLEFRNGLIKFFGLLEIGCAPESLAKALLSFAIRKHFRGIVWRVRILSGNDSSDRRPLNRPLHPENRRTKKQVEQPPHLVTTPACTTPRTPEKLRKHGAAKKKLTWCKRICRINGAPHARIAAAPKPQMRSTALTDYRDTSARSTTTPRATNTTPNVELRGCALLRSPA
ncbi:MAG: hypothetical protein EPN14_08380 [Gallionella sp.]|nr:MAG: hypothetical protein EPN14_08380 [Gallionella sp.]